MGRVLILRKSDGSGQKFPPALDSNTKAKESNTAPVSFIPHEWLSDFALATYTNIKLWPISQMFQRAETSSSTKERKFRYRLLVLHPQLRVWREVCGRSSSLTLCLRPVGYCYILLSKASQTFLFCDPTSKMNFLCGPIDLLQRVKTLVIRVNVPFQISSGIFVYSKIMKMHTVHERKYKIIKEPPNRNIKANKS